MNVCRMFAETRSEHWVTEPHQLVNIKLTESGFGAREPTTVIRILKSTVQNHGTRPALCLKRPVDGVLPADYKVWTWNQYYEESRMFAKSLIFLKVETFKCTNILGFNSPEWFIANTGSILAGCVAAGIYTTNLAEACHYISNHSSAEVVVVEGNKQVHKHIKCTNS
jgi:long-chain-fatty-acid--CoA ligase ACSBG